MSQIRVGFYTKENLPLENSWTKSNEERKIFYNKLLYVEIYLAERTEEEPIECLFDDTKYTLIYTYKNYTWSRILQHYIGVYKIEIPDDFYNFIMENAMIRVGFWQMDGFFNPETKYYPNPIENSNNRTKEEVELFLEKLEKIERYEAKTEDNMGFSYCRICNIENGSREYIWNRYIWPSGYKHYIKKHNIEINDDFYEEVKNHIVELEGNLLKKKLRKEIEEHVFSFMRFLDGIDNKRYE